jgi:hypothetical protein
MALQSRISRRTQKGAALLALLMIFIVAASYSLVKKLNANTRDYLRQGSSLSVLNQAKQSLIGYAINYPEIDAMSVGDIINGPGYLPCPDINNDGSSGGTCSLAGNTTIGRFPYKTLEVHDLKDSSGARIWYALSDNFRNNPGLDVLNSETEAQFTVDGTADIVAVIIAPGIPIGSQNRDPDDTNILTEIVNYLELDNNNFDTSFISIDPDPSDPNDFNDLVVTITRDELMSAVEKRVLGEVEAALRSYKTTMGAYPWLSPFADPKTVEKRLTGQHTAANGAANLTDSAANFIQWGVANNDVVRNIMDGSSGLVTNVTATTLTIGAGLNFGTENDFDTDDDYFIDVRAAAAVFTGTATAGSAGVVMNDSGKDFTKLNIQPGDIIENITGGSSGVIESVTATQITVDELTGGVNNFSVNDVYQIRLSMGQATATNANNLILEDSSVDFTVMGVQSGDLIRNITDDSYGRISNVAANQLTVTELNLGTDNIFEQNDYYSIPRFNSNKNTRHGHVAILEKGEPFKTDLNLSWDFTASPFDINVINSTLLQDYIDNYVNAESESFDDTVANCIWFKADFVDCFASYKDFVNISGRVDVISNSTSIRDDDTGAFITDGVKRGDIAQNYDDEISVATGTVDAGNSGIATADTDTNGQTLEDTDNNFIDVNINVGDIIFNTTDNSSGAITSVTTNQITASLSGGTDNIFQAGDTYTIDGDPRLYDATPSTGFSFYERYSYVIQNNTLEGDLGEGKIQGVISDITGDNILEAKSYEGEGEEPIIFRPGDAYQIYQPRKFVVETVASESILTTDNYTSTTAPDFDDDEYYRIMPAANSMTARVELVNSIGATDTFTDSDVDFIDLGVEVGDIVENAFGAFGEITAVTTNTITTRLYGDLLGIDEEFVIALDYTVYYDYVYSREHTLHAKFAGNQGTRPLLEERVSDVCLGYNADCTALTADVNFSGNGGVALVTINDYQEDEATNIGTATFTPTNLSTGNLLVSYTDFSLSLDNDNMPEWFLNNGWHKLIYVAYSAGDAPGAAACTAGNNCLTINGIGTPNNDKQAIVIAAGEPIDTTRDSACNVIASVSQDRTSGNKNEYYELENCNADDTFDKQPVSPTFSDQVKIIEP